MERNQKIDYQILKYAKELGSVYKDMDDDIVDYVFKKFRISNFFRINKIYRVEIYNRLQKLIEQNLIRVVK